ncbi:MAG: NAD(P)-dependent alcohol dehydrogenase [Deltaproteobacteria bacterium]|nr:NAD(P)-dependent alcohol dehydrogenase [Deltaproteobacteria bacterium]
MIETRAYAAFAADKPLAPWTLSRREPLANDVVIDILFSGICHSDLHTVRSEWRDVDYPLVPGHEILGKVSRVGSGVTRFKVGDLAAVGCMVDSCRTCSSCQDGLEQYCDAGMIQTYGSKDADGRITQGGYATNIVVDEKYVLRAPTNIAPERVAPLLCAGITTYSPLRHWKVGKGSRVAVLGLGGLGHMAVKIAHAMGAEVTMLSGTASKQADAKKLGAHEFVLTSDKAAVKRSAKRFDLIIDTVSGKHDLPTFLGMLKLDGKLVVVGASPEPLELPLFPLIFNRRSISGSLIGGIAETQEMLDFCSQHELGADVEVIEPSQINQAYERLLKSDVRYRFVIDTGKL